ncbi:hypothetical protein FQA39_LY10590 [Lamprigera yunnana]|nr:hypothetical protein FQA39_LY10590 [Lamprigera yunnana]
MYFTDATITAATPQLYRARWHQIKKEKISYCSSKTKKVYNLSNLTSDELFDLLESTPDNTDVDGDELEGDFEDDDCVADPELS